MYWMAFGELGSYLVSLLLAVVAYIKSPVTTVLLQVPVALIVFCVSVKTFHWFVHLGYEPETEPDTET